MLDFIADKEKAKRTACKYGLKLNGDFELKKVCFIDKKNHDGIFWTYHDQQAAALISVFGYLKIVEKNKIQTISDVIQGEKYPMCGSCFKVILRPEGISLTPSRFEN